MTFSVPLNARRTVFTPLLLLALGGVACTGTCEELIGLETQAIAVAPALSRVTVDLPGVPLPAEPLATSEAYFSRYVVDNFACGAAYSVPADMNGDGRLELLVSQFGPTGGLKLPFGSLTLYTQVGGLNAWSPTSIMVEEEKFRFPNQPAAEDIDGDGDLDIWAPAGFFVCEVVPFHGPCGALSWYEQPGQPQARGGVSGTSQGQVQTPSPVEVTWTRHDVVPQGSLAFFHRVLMHDLNGDGRRDVITVGERRKGDEVREAFLYLFLGDDSPERFAKTPIQLAEGLGGLPGMADLDQDGDMDFYSAEFFANMDSFAWVEQVRAPTTEQPQGEFVRHAISTELGFAMQLKLVPNLLGDGVTYAVGTNHTNTTNEDGDEVEPGVFLFSLPTDVRQPWPAQRISGVLVSEEGKGKAAPGMFDAGDVDGDGDLDLVVVGDGDPRLFWLEQSSMGTFDMRVIEEGLGGGGGIHLTDLDGDGMTEIVMPGYAMNAVLIYQWNGTHRTTDRGIGGDETHKQ